MSETGDSTSPEENRGSGETPTEPAAKPAVGFIGLGRMGAPMAANLVKAGFPLTVFDMLPARVKLLADQGATSVRAIAEMVPAVDIIVTMLPESRDVFSCVMGPSNVRPNARAGQVVMDMSTIAPRTTDLIADGLREKGVGFVDAAVGRTVAFAERGKALFMVGAEADDLATVRPLLEAMGDTIIHCGGPGAGIRAKLVNNYLAISTAQLSAEAIALGTKIGLPLQTLLSVLTGTTATNGQLATNWPAKVFRGDIEPGFSLDLANKDMTLALELAKAEGIDSETANAAAAKIAQAIHEGGLGKADFSALLVASCALADVSVPTL